MVSFSPRSIPVPPGTWTIFSVEKLSHGKGIFPGKKTPEK
jgi:hypothetical protein